MSTENAAVPVEQPVMSLSQAIILPSQGILYKDRVPGGRVTVKAMRMAEEKLLADQGRDRAEVLNTLIQNCTEGLNMPFSDVLVADKLYLLFLIRVVSFGPAVEFGMKCGKCTNTNHYRLDITKDIETRLLDHSVGNPEPFPAMLPIERVKLGLRYLRVADELEIERYARQQTLTRKQEGDPTYTYRLARMIQTVNDQPISMIDALSLVERLYSSDSGAISDALEENDFGLNLRLSLPCGRCGAAIEEVFPFTADFFRPKHSAARRP